MKQAMATLSLILTSCVGLRPFPTDSFYTIDVQHGVCGHYQITNTTTFQVAWVEDLPLKSCDGNVSLAHKDYLPVKKWILDTVAKYNQCKEAQQ